MCILCNRIFSSVGRFVVTSACATPQFRKMRERLIPEATGDVLEIGVGSGYNFDLYATGKVNSLVAVDPDRELLALARRRIEELRQPAELIEASAERLPLAPASIDTVVSSYVLCTVGEPEQAIAEIRRVLRPGGKLIFLEHALARGRLLPHVQRKLNAAWRLVAGGCNLTRDPGDMLAGAGFHVDLLAEQTFKGQFSLLGRHLAGVARVPRAEGAFGL